MTDSDKLALYEAALHDIANPMVELQRKVDESNGELRLNGMMANKLCADAHWIKQKAVAALAKGREETYAS